MTRDALNKILKAHRKWLNNEADGERANLSGAKLSYADLSGADLSRANLSGADLSGADLSDANLFRADLSGANLFRADLSGADLSYAKLSDANLFRADLSGADLSDANLFRADLSYAKLSGADLSGADLSYAKLSGADLSGADLSRANLSGADGLLSAINYMEAHFERTEHGYFAYKTFGAMYAAPKEWEIKPGAVIKENVNMCRADDCGCGINVAPLEWVKAHYNGKIWRVLIRWEWLCGVCVPYNTDGKIRCERVELVEVVKEEQDGQ